MPSGLWYPPQKLATSSLILCEVYLPINPDETLTCKENSASSSAVTCTSARKPTFECFSYSSSGMPVRARRSTSSKSFGVTCPFPGSKRRNMLINDLYSILTRCLKRAWVAGFTAWTVFAIIFPLLASDTSLLRRWLVMVLGEGRS